MSLDNSALERSLLTYSSTRKSGGTHRKAIEAAIADYEKELFKPGQLFVGEPVRPQRDYRKELWIATSVSHRGTATNNIEYCKRVVEAFDEFFGENK